MRFLGRRINFHNLQRKLETLYDEKVLFALEKMQLHIDINSLPSTRREIINSRIADLENFDKEANFFKSSYQKSKINNMMTSSQYFEFITDDELFECIPKHIIAKLLMNNRNKTEYLSNVLMYKNLFGKEFLEFIMRQDNPLETIDYLRAVDWLTKNTIANAYRKYLNDHPDADKDLLMRNLIYVCSNSSTKRMRVEVKSGDDLFNIEDCYRSSIERCNFSNRGRFDYDLICTYLYGLNYFELDNIVNKYGADLEFFKPADSYAISKIMKLNPKYYQRIIALYPAISMIGLSDDDIIDIDEKRLEDLTKIQDTFSLIKEMKIIIDTLKNPVRDENELVDYVKEKAKNRPFVSFIDFQNHIISLFENEYNCVLYNPVRDAVRVDDLSEKLGVEVYEIDYEKLDRFYGLMREENIFHKDIKKTKDERYEVDKDIYYDGKATSPVNAKNFKLVPILADDVIGGYVQMNGLQNMAPWDFISWKSVEYELTPEREGYNKNPPGIVFHMPNRLMENTRLGAAEVTLYDHQLADATFKKINPDYYFYETGGKFDPKNPKSVEANIDRFPEIEKNNDLYKQWYMTVEEAKYFGKAILLGNTQKFLEYYQKKVIDLQKRYISSNNTREKIELMEEIILTFEACSNSINTPNTHRYRLESDFFGYEYRNGFYNSILRNIETEIKNDPEQGKQLLQAYKTICEKELDKLYTITSSRGGGAFFPEGELFNFRADNFPLENSIIEQLDKIAILEAEQFGGEYTTFRPSDTLKELMKSIRQPIGKEVHYNVPGAVHGVEHADKVALFGDAISQREGLSDRDRKIVNIACMLHDWKRVDNSRNNYHGRDGAKLIVKEFKAGNLDFLGLTKEDIPMLATAVCYHNYILPKRSNKYFKKYNLLDDLEISNELRQFGVDGLNLSKGQYKDYLLRTMRVASIVRDADNLDRFRFSKENILERTRYSYLMTDAAKSPELRAYANFINQSYARMVLEKNYPSELLEEDEKTDYVNVLDKTRLFLNGRNGRNLGPNFAENHEIPIPIDELWDRLYSLNPTIKVPNPIHKEPILDSAIEASKEIVRTGKMNDMINAIKNFLLNLWHGDDQR